MSGIDRKQFIRIDCPSCSGNGYVSSGMGESSCERCGGSGLLEKEIDYRFDTHGKISKEDIAREFGVPVQAVRDAGHSAGE